jgi:hypothetical protein
MNYRICFGSNSVPLSKQKSSKYSLFHFGTKSSRSAELEGTLESEGQACYTRECSFVIDVLGFRRQFD